MIHQFFGDAELFALLIKNFTERSRCVETEQHNASVEHRGRFLELIKLFDEARERDRHQQERTADDFNILEVLRLTYNEVRHSMVLAWLLDHDVDGHGTHCQGTLGFRLFIREFKLPERYEVCRYWVKREVGGDESIVDIELAARGQFLIWIENKIWANEGPDQTHHEWADLLRRAIELGICVNQPDPPIHAFFLTPSGAKAMSQHFKPISWRSVASVLTAFAEKAQPPEVKLFAAHYAKAIERFIVTQGREDGEEHVETVVE